MRPNLELTAPLPTSSQEYSRWESRRGQIRKASSESMQNLRALTQGSHLQNPHVEDFGADDAAGEKVKNLRSRIPLLQQSSASLFYPE